MSYSTAEFRKSQADGPGTLLHARPYDAPARGKMERFWRRLREEALDHVGEVASLTDVECKLRTWLARDVTAQRHRDDDGDADLHGRAPCTARSKITPKHSDASTPPGARA